MKINSYGYNRKGIKTPLPVFKGDDMGEKDLVVGRVEPIRNSLASDVPVYKEDKFWTWIKAEERYVRDQIEKMDGSNRDIYKQFLGYLQGLEAAEVFYAKLK